MREIKFRAMSMCKGEHWLYGDLRHYNRNPRTEKWTIHDPNTGIETDIDETTIGQFTGLKDKKHREIYEGDIVKKHDPYSVYASDYTGIVEWHKCRWMVRRYCMGYWDYGDLMFDDFADFKLTVIGNIYDDIELREKILSQGKK